MHTGWAECVYIFSRVCILCVCIALICLCVLILLCFPGQLSHLPYRFWRSAGVTNLNEPPRALATSTI